MRNRTRALIAATGIAVAATLALAGPAGAAEHQIKFANKGAEECYKKLAEGQTVDDCQQAPSPLLPSKNEIIWGSLAFLVVAAGMWKFGVPAVRNMEKAREDRIRTDLERAEHARTDAEAERAQYQSQIAGARDEAARIVDEARQAADGVRSDLTQRAEADAALLRQKAQDDIRLATERAMADLRQQVATMSVELASRIVERNLDPATQQQLIESYISSVGSN